MSLTNLLLSTLLSMQINAQPSAHSDTAFVDITGNGLKEKIILYQNSAIDSNFCKILKFNPKDSSYVKLWKAKLNLEEGKIYEIFVDDYNEDGIQDFTIEIPNTGIFWYYTYDKKKKKFIMKE